jgi:hypothetical protein
MAITLSNATLMDRFFVLRDLSTIDNTPFFKIATVEWGYGFIEQVDGSDSVMTIPTTADGLETVLDENVPDLSYVNNVINLRCVLPAGAVAEGDVYNFSAISVKDAEGNCIAISAVLPIPLTNNRVLQFDIQIEVV